MSSAVQQAIFGYGQPASTNNNFPGWYDQAVQQYGALQNQIQGMISGVGRSQQQAIADTYAQQRGAADQQLASQGLGNTTVRQTTNRGLTLDEQKAQIALQNQLAQLSAGYAAQLGGAQLGFETQYANQQQQYAQQQQLQQQGYAQQLQLAGLQRQGVANNLGLANRLQGASYNSLSTGEPINYAALTY